MLKVFGVVIENVRAYTRANHIIKIIDIFIRFIFNQFGILNECLACYLTVYDNGLIITLII